MQQIINFNIEIEKGYADIAAEIKQIILNYIFEDVPSKKDRINRWVDAIVFSKLDQDAGIIRNDSEEQMFVFDYDVIFPDLFSDITVSCPGAVFFAHSEYYNDDCGVVSHHDKKYINGTLKNGKKSSSKADCGEYVNISDIQIKAGSEDIPFSYEKIDEIPCEIYKQIDVEEGITEIDDERLQISINGLNVDVNLAIAADLKEISKEFENALRGTDLTYPVYDPIDAITKLGGGLEMFGIAGFIHEAKACGKEAGFIELSNAQIAHRVKIFSMIVSLMHSESTLKIVVGTMPKKKNGTLYAKRVTPIAALLIMDEDASMYALRAVANSGTEITIEIRKNIYTDLKKLNSDLSSKTNLFRN